jgi:multidrug efflux pump subunit AcrA (membrane-fusion protein)
MLGGAFEGGGLGGGGVQNLLAGLAQRARTGRQNAVAEGAPAENEPARISLFNPNAILGLVAALTRPLKYLFVPLLLLVPATVWIAYAQREILVQDIGAFDVSVVGTVILGLVVANFFSRFMQGTFIRGFGGAVNQFGIALTFGIPRFFVDLGGIAMLDRRGQLWAHAAPLIARLGLCGAGTLLWLALRQSTPSTAHLALVVGQIGLLAFLLSALSLLPSNGYRWLATYFGRPGLRADALASTSGRLSRAVEDGDATVSGSPAVTFYVLAIALAVSALALVAQTYFDVATTGNVRPLSAALLLGLGIAIAAWGVALWNYGRGRQIEALDADATRLVLTNWMGHADLASDRPVTVGTVGKVFWAVVACALVAVAFLPYRYSPAGTFEILPTARTVVATRTSGDLEQVFVHEGDWVKANQALAKLSSDDQQQEINITRAELDRAKAQLAQFGGKATTQESDPGLDALNRSIADALSDEPDTAGAKNDAAATNYTKTQAEHAARAEVERLTRKLAYARDQLADTTVRAPKDGRVMTPNVHLLTGIWLRRGAELLSLADTSNLEAEIDIPEADIGFVKVGDKVRIRPWSAEDREIAGTVTEIAPAAQTRPYGTVVRVRASIPNEEANLRPAVTGYAKIDGDDLRVWEAFLGRIIRVVRIEMWSWIP